MLTAGTPFPRCDGLWSDEPGQAMALVTADCLPVALCTTTGAPALAVLHVGWRGLLAGILATGCEALGPGEKAAAVGPGIGPCRYEVGEEVASPFRAAFGDDVAADGRLDLWTSAERALHAAGCTEIERVDRCSACQPESFCTGATTAARDGRGSSGMWSSAEIAAAYRRVCEEVGPDV